MDTKLEAVLVPVSDVDRAKQFYAALGWREDADFAGDDGYRIVQLTPPASGCSIQFGSGLTSMAPGSVEGLLLVVSDVGAARAELVERGVQVSEVYHDVGALPRARFHLDDTSLQASGPAPDRATYGSYASFSDPDGNGWVVQEITMRLPGREWETPKDAMDGQALAELLREAEEHHGRYEPTAPKHHWWDWYAAYVVARQHGRSRDESYGDASAALDAA